jgi:hypothetical protein
VTATKAADSTYGATSSVATKVTFVAPGAAGKHKVVKPTVTSAPGVLNAGKTSTLVLNGSGFVAGTQVATNAKGVGVKIISMTAVTITSLVSVAGNVKPNTYVLTVSNKNGDASTTFRIKVTTPKKTAGSLVDALFSGYRLAWASSPTAGITYAFQHDYPGSATTQDAFLACLQNAHTAQTGESDVPQLNTLRPIQNWRGSGPNTKTWNFAGKKPNGQTYTVTDVVTSRFSDGSSRTSQSQVHVTILNGQAYFYFTPAC